MEFAYDSINTLLKFIQSFLDHFFGGFMKRDKTFTFRITDNEREMINDLAIKLSRSRSDAVRWILHSYADRFDIHAGDVLLEDYWRNQRNIN